MRRRLAAKDRMPEIRAQIDKLREQWRAAAFTVALALHQAQVGPQEGEHFDGRTAQL
jgi:hypothetical protein